MGYDLSPKNTEAGPFHFGAFSFPVLLEACGYLFSSIHHGGQWYCVWAADPRMGDHYPRILSNDGFEVTAEEAAIMARIARNFVAVQRTLPDENRGTGIASKMEFKREDVMEMLQHAMYDQKPGEVWPQKIRDDFTKKFEAFAAWAEKSGGFQIW